MNQTEPKIPLCIGVIMDGNRRWAEEHNLPKFEGHRQGYEKLKELVTWAGQRGIKHLVVFALSTENWNRATDEVSYLLELFRLMLKKDISELHEKNIRVSFIGDLARFPDDIKGEMQDAQDLTKMNDSLHLALAVSYGGRAEIVAGVNQLLAKGEGGTTEDVFSGALWSSGIPDPDLVIRTGGEKRLSGFLTWGTVYSELFFSDTHWPAFTGEEFDRILATYSQRERRFGA